MEAAEDCAEEVVRLTEKDDIVAATSRRSNGGYSLLKMFTAYSEMFCCCSLLGYFSVSVSRFMPV
jgi:hypothetical protein